MLILLKKEKIISYLITICIIIMLFVAGNFMPVENETMQTSAKTSKDLPIYSVETNENKVALTINCAWTNDDIEDILQTLKSNNCKATFFLVGDWIDRYEKSVKMIYENGHEIANHSNTHPHVGSLNLEKNIEEIKLTADKIEKLTGKRSNLYRGPYGEYNDTVLKAAKEQSHTMIQWSIDSLDYNDLTCDEMLERIEPNLKNGSIILMHSGAKNTASSLDKIIKTIQNKGYELVTVSDLIYEEGRVDNQGVQHSI